MRAVLVLVIVAVGLIGTIWSRFIGVLLYVWFALFRPQEWSFWALWDLRLSLVIWATTMSMAFATGALPNLTHPLSIATLAFVGCTLIAQLNAADPATGWVAIETLLITISIALVGVTLTKTRRQVIWLIAVVSGSIGAHAASWGLSFLASGGSIRLSGGIGGMFDENNGFALGIARVLFLLVAVAQNVDYKWIRLGFMAAVPLSVFTLIGTYSRGGFLAALAALIVFTLLQRRRMLAIGMVCVVIAGMLITVGLPDEYVNRIETIRTYEEVGEGSALSRLHFWQVALEMVKDYPFGIGVKNYEVVFDRYDFLNGLYGRGRSVHSTHFQVLAETGYPGFIVYVFLIWYSLRLCWRVRARARTEGLSHEDSRFMTTVSGALIASIVAFVVGGSFASQVLNDLNWLTFALISMLDRTSREMVAQAVASRTIPANVAAA